MFNELSLIEELRSRFNHNSAKVVVGIGDDCAAVKPAGGLMLYSTDTVTEGVHFQTSYMTCSEIAVKSVSAAVSDIAAMGGKPLYFLSTLGIPRCFSKNQTDELLKGFGDSSENYGIELIGGNITGSEKLFIDITVIGEVDDDKVVRRSDASVGDSLFVTGTLGDSAMGLELLKSGNGKKDGYHEKRHKEPTARTDAGKMLADLFLASAMIDISDGFLLDLERITLEHDKGVDIYLDKIPLSEHSRGSKCFSKDPLSYALSGGEDYELLFAARPGCEEKIGQISSELNIDITEIGTVTNKNKIELYRQDKEVVEYYERGFVHL